MVDGERVTGMTGDDGFEIADGGVMIEIVEVLNGSLAERIGGADGAGSGRPGGLGFLDGSEQCRQQKQP